MKKTYPSKVFVNEILPSPEGPDAEEEWIEIFNENDFQVDISFWEIKDTEGRTKTFTFPKGTKIKAQGFLILKRPETKITLNNTGDGLKLILPDGTIIDEVYFGKAPEGESFNKIDGDWSWSSTLTPGDKNFIPQIKEKEKVGQIESEELAGALTETVPEAKISTNFFFVFSLALVLAFFSGILVLILKKKLRELTKEKN